jgi:hypothetical protein
MEWGFPGATAVLGDLLTDFLFGYGCVNHKKFGYSANCVDRSDFWPRFASAGSDEW